MPEWTKSYTISLVDVGYLAGEILVSPAALSLVGNGSTPDGAIRFTDPDQLVIAVYEGEPAQSVKDALDAAVLAHDYISAYKSTVNEYVDTETERRISGGFEYPSSSGKVFSLSPNAQLNWLGLELKAALLPYPYIIRTFDEKDVYGIVNEADAHLMVDAAFIAKETSLTLGRMVKTAVEAAVSIAAVDTAAASWLNGGPP